MFLCNKFVVSFFRIREVSAPTFYCQSHTHFSIWSAVPACWIVSSQSVTVILFTVPGDLDAPRLSPDSKSMLLQWDHPSKPNGIIIQYSIYMNGSLLLNVTGNTTKYRVTNLQPFTLYTFAVAACTVVACKQSPYSPALRTLESGKKDSFFWVRPSSLVLMFC